MHCVTRKKYDYMVESRKAYATGQNVTKLLREKYVNDINESKMIEIAYDMQAGDYVQFAKEYSTRLNNYAAQLANILADYIGKDDTLLDIGTGEMTTLCAVLGNLPVIPKKTFATDISWSRLFYGRGFASESLGSESEKIKPFVSDIKEIPLPSSSVDVLTTSHALEPNGEHLETVLSELFRVARKYLVLFEPSYERNSPEGQKRMDELGYIKGLESTVEKLGWSVESVMKIDSPAKPLNPTYCHIIPVNKDISDYCEPVFTVPGTDYSLTKKNNFFFSSALGICFPVLEELPVFRSESAILASAYGNESSA